MVKKDKKTYLPTNDSTGFLVRSLYQSFNRLLAQKIAGANLTTAQWFFLRSLEEKDGVAQRELSHSVGLTESTTVAALKILEKNGLIKRKRDTEDSRRIIVRLTPKGRKLVTDLLPDALPINLIAHKKMSARQIKEFKETIRAMRDRLEEAAAEEA